MKRLAILTGGGDAPGLNAVIRAAVKTALFDYDCEILGVRNGLDGFIEENGVLPLDTEVVRGILPRGGTILGAANRGNPFSRKVERDGKVVVEDRTQEIVDAIHSYNLDALIVAGGDGTLAMGETLFEHGIPIIGVPKTIDNDVGGTDYTFGFDTALNVAMEALDRLHSTAEAHHRVMILELMGRDAGFIALTAGISGGADVILIPEIPFEMRYICRKINSRVQRGTYFSIISASEGATPLGEKQRYAISGDEVTVPRLGGIGQWVAKELEESCGVETRVTVLGHLQRGGSPTAFDRQLATRYGSAAVRLAAEGKFGHMVALRGTEIVDVSLADALEHPKRVNVDGDMVRTARALGISLGDEYKRPAV
jgi:ATP-dependent phosphofructokinase / diphosphate-dependent phosphofructokinase